MNVHMDGDGPSVGGVLREAAKDVRKNGCGEDGCCAILVLAPVAAWCGYALTGRWEGGALAACLVLASVSR